MKEGQTLQTLAQQILTEAGSKKDYAMNTEKLRMTPTGELSFKVKSRKVVLPVTQRCLNQIANRVGIPRAYANRMHKDAPHLLADNVNHWFENEPETRMLRTVQNGTQMARAFLSQSYRPFDNADLVEAVVPRLIDAGCEVKSAQLTERRFYIQAVTPKLQAEVKVGDVVQAGVTISNSEVGCGSVHVEPLAFRLACLNGMIFPTAMRRHHVGKRGDGEWDEGHAFEVFSDSTRKLDDRAFWAKVNDVVTDALTQVSFMKHVERMKDSTKVDTGKPTEAVEIVTKRYKLSDGEGESVLEHLTRGGDLSLWGLANAVTRTAEDVEGYDRAVELERLGSEVIELPKNVFSN